MLLQQPIQLMQCFVDGFLSKRILFGGGVGCEEGGRRGQRVGEREDLGVEESELEIDDRGCRGGHLDFDEIQGGERDCASMWLMFLWGIRRETWRETRLEQPSYCSGTSTTISLPLSQSKVHADGRLQSQSRQQVEFEII
jgi:hypothetical protein